jgi:Putative prokaryotic signal transducing protein
VSLTDPVPLVTVHDETEAELVVGLLRGSDIACEWQMTTQGLAGIGGSSGAREIFVEQKDLETAQALLSAQKG